MNSDREVTKQDRQDMVRMVKEILGDDKARDWWITSNPILGNLKPCWMFDNIFGAERRLRNFIFDAYENDKKWRASSNG